MKILIYLGHPAHFHLYRNAIVNWQNSGHQCLILIKKKDVLEDLVRLAGFHYFNILVEGRKDTGIGIFVGLIKRSFRLLLFCLNNKPDILTGTSVENSFIGNLLRIPVVNLNEDDAAIVPFYAKLSYPGADVILNPKVCNSGKWDNKAIKYESYHELAYLHPNHFIPDINIVEKYFPSDLPYFIIRFAKLNAHHDFGISGINDNIAERLIEILKPHGRIFITSERKFDERFEPYRININPLDIHHVMAFSQIFIGDSQTMAAEAGVLGVPFIRFNDFVGKIGYLNELELKYELGYGVKTCEPQKLFESLHNLLNMPDRQAVFAKRREKMLSEKIDFSEYLTYFINNYPVSNLVKKPLSGFKLKNLDFTPEAYQNLLLTLKNNGYQFITFEQWSMSKPNDKLVIIRHDVDLLPFNSLATAKIEAQLDIKATYYFRCVKQSNNPDVIKSIVELGHEIGYHYEDLSLFSGNFEKSISHFEKMLKYFRNFYPVKTISMHGSPASVYDNRDIWKKYNYNDFGIIGEPYFDFINNKDYIYFTETARMWSGEKYNIRDKSLSGSNYFDITIHSTYDLINWINTSNNRYPVMITTHPQRWTDNKFEWISEFLFQNVKNLFKNLLLKLK